MSDGCFKLQDDAYVFPYHHLPTIASDGRIVIYRVLSWGLRYLTYMTYVRDQIIAMGPQSVCDVGCGDGYLLHMLGDVQHRVGVDLSLRAVGFAQAFDPDVEWYCCPVSEVPGVYDVVSCVETLEHVSDAEVRSFVAGLRAKVAPEGRLIITVPTVNRRLNPKHYRHYTVELLRQHLSPHFVMGEIVWLFNTGLFTSMLKRLLSNRLFLLQHASTLRLIWKVHQRHGFFAAASNGAHLVAVASPHAIEGE